MLGRSVVQGFVVLDLEPDEAATTVRGRVLHVHVEGCPICCVLGTASSGGVLEADAGDAPDAIRPQAPEDAGREIELRREFSEQIEGEGLARQEIRPEAVLLDSLA